MPGRRVYAIVTVAIFLFASGAFAVDAGIVVGSKNFPESYLLAEIIAQRIEAETGSDVGRRVGLGGTGIAFEALSAGEIDLYPEYTGTLAQAVLKQPDRVAISDLREALAERGLTVSDPLGFNNTYALAVRRETAERLGLETLSDLAAKGGALTGVFSYEFMNRPDGFPALRDAYNLNLSDVRRMEHSLAYEAIQSGRADVVDVYTTDATIEELDLAVLEDDRDFFPDYEAVVIARLDFVARRPFAWSAVEELEGRFTGELMTHLNGLVEREGRTFAEVADLFLASQLWAELREKEPLSTGPAPGAFGRYAQASSPYWRSLWSLTKEHLFLVSVSLIASIVAGFGLALAARAGRPLAHTLLALTGVLQTIPSLALLCFLIPLFGVGTVPALIALFLYGLLPIVRNTYTGLESIEIRHRETAAAIGLSRWETFRHVELPIAASHILDGIKTSAVVNVGTATLAAFIGAGGYGTLIVTGLALNDVAMILRGALPAALLAILVHWLFEGLDGVFVPPPLRIGTGRERG